MSAHHSCCHRHQAFLANLPGVRQAAGCQCHAVLARFPKHTDRAVLDEDLRLGALPETILVRVLNCIEDSLIAAESPIKLNAHPLTTAVILPRLNPCRP